MGKKAIRKENNKASSDSNDMSLMKKSVSEKLANLAKQTSTLKTKQKGLKKQWSAIRKEQTIIAGQYQRMEKRIASISQLQLDYQEIKDHLTAELENVAQVHTRLDNLESAEQIDQKKAFSLKKKGVMEKLAKLTNGSNALKTKQKELKKLFSTLQKEQATLAQQYQWTERQVSGITKLQLDHQEVKDHLASEIESAAQTRHRVDKLESRERAGQEQINALKLQMEQHLRLAEDYTNKLAAGKRLAAHEEPLKEQLDYLSSENKELESRFSGLAGELIDLKSDNTQFNSSIDSLSSKFDDAVNKLQENLLQSPLPESRIDKLNQADSQLSHQLEQQHERLQGLTQLTDKLDNRTYESTGLTRALQEQIKELKDNVKQAENHLLEEDRELKKKAQHFDSKLQHLSSKHGKLAERFLVAGILLIILAGIGITYWMNTGFTSLQVDTLAQRLEYQENQLTDHMQHFAAKIKASEGNQAFLEGEWNAKFEQIERNRNELTAGMTLLANKQDQMLVTLEQLEKARNDTSMRLAQTDNLYAELVSEQDKKQIAAIQQEENLETAVRSLQESQTQLKKTTSPVNTPDKWNAGWLKGLNPRHYTIQIFAGYNAASVSRIAARADLKQEMAIHKTKFKQRDWYVLLYGDFSSISKARSAVRKLPKDIRANNPWVRNLSVIQSDMAAQ